MRTTLNLLTRDGAVYMDFRPELNANLYQDLWTLIHELDTSEEMREAVSAWAEASGLSVSFDQLVEA